MANDMVPDEEPMQRDLERVPVCHYRHQVPPGTKPQPQWCPSGLTKSQRRRIQRLKNDGLEQERQREALEKKRGRSEVWRVKRQGHDQDGSDGSAADINMIFYFAK